MSPAGGWAEALCRGFENGAMEYAEHLPWAGAQANANRTGKTVAQIWQSTGGDPVEDRLITNRAGRYHHAYRQLCSDTRECAQS